MANIALPTFGFRLTQPIAQADTFLPIPPNQLQDALSFNVLIEHLTQKYGAPEVQKALNPKNRYPSPLQKAKTTSPNWLQHSVIVGINPRAMGKFWNMAQYAATKSTGENAFHLLPVFKNSMDKLYQPINWDLTTEFFDPELAQKYPQLNTPEAQLKVTINLMHLMGKTVGMDVLRHTDRGGEDVFLHPSFFEWVKIKDNHIIDRRDDLHSEAETVIKNFLKNYGDGRTLTDKQENALPPTHARGMNYIAESRFITGKNYPQSNTFFSDTDTVNLCLDKERAEILFGPENFSRLRRERRVLLMNHLKAHGLFTTPVVDIPPYAPAQLGHMDKNGWPVFKINDAFNQKEGAFQSIFGSLTPYKLFHLNPDGSHDTSRPVKPVWDYLAQRYLAFQRAYGFDFMRGDMAHVEPRFRENHRNPQSNKAQWYDLFGYILHTIQTQGEAPYFAFLPEALMWAKDWHQNRPLDHIRNMNSTVALGSLQHVPLGEGHNFANDFKIHMDNGQHIGVPMASSIMTADSDDPHHQHLYGSTHKNMVRLFVGLFHRPTYLGMGFEMKGNNWPWPSDSQEAMAQQTTHGSMNAARGTPYQWGNNPDAYANYTRLRNLLETYKHNNDTTLEGYLQQAKAYVLELDKRDTPLMVWTLAPKNKPHAPDYVCVANTQIFGEPYNYGLDMFTRSADAEKDNLHLEAIFSSHGLPHDKLSTVEKYRTSQDYYWQRIKHIQPGECRVYRVHHRS